MLECVFNIISSSILDRPFDSMISMSDYKRDDLVLLVSMSFLLSQSLEKWITIYLPFVSVGVVVNVITVNIKTELMECTTLPIDQSLPGSILGSAVVFFSSGVRFYICKD